MVHLSHETLSELLDGVPAPGAEAHLTGCPVCQGELETMRGLRAELRELPELEPPPESLSAGRYWLRQIDPRYLQRASYTVSRDAPPIESRSGATRSNILSGA